MSKLIVADAAELHVDKSTTFQAVIVSSGHRILVILIFVKREPSRVLIFSAKRPINPSGRWRSALLFTVQAPPTVQKRHSAFTNTSPLNCNHGYRYVNNAATCELFTG